jgi:hypothetical protein
VTRCYPRLTRGDAGAIFEELRAIHASGGRSMLTDHARFDHERKVPVATGRIATPDEIARVRQVVLEDMASWLAQEHVSDKSVFDAALGRSLHDVLDIVPADAAHEGTWSFLTLVVFPDIAAARFPDFHVNRFVGTPRNALRRSWQRQEILGGGEPQEGGRPLGEDELVGLFERSALVRNRRLAKALAQEVQVYGGPKRSQWARDLYKLATLQSGVRLLDALDDVEIARFVASLVEGLDVR